MDCIIDKTVFERVLTKNVEGEFSIVRDKYFVLVFATYIGKYNDNFNKERYVDPSEIDELRKNNINVVINKKVFFVFVHKDIYKKYKLNERLKCGYTYKLKVTIQRFINRFSGLPKGSCFYLIGLKDLGNDKNLYHSYLYLTLTKDDFDFKMNNEGKRITSNSRRGSSSYLKINDERNDFDIIVPIYLKDSLISTITDLFSKITLKSNISVTSGYTSAKDYSQSGTYIYFREVVEIK